jgi:predicted  nucleic acid-binding Zn-ribbon protein|tara:strand:- start:143 stop:553 length:411 start_codon:yes stop_codon:yes gene_type:complete
MTEQESILKLNTDIQTLKIKDEYRTKELDALMKKLDASTNKLNDLSENIGRLLTAQDVNKMTDNEFREEMKILHSRIGDLQDKMNQMVDKTETRMNSDINLIYTKLESLERWRWITIGAATLVAWLLTNVIPKILP